MNATNVTPMVQPPPQQTHPPFPNSTHERPLGFGDSPSSLAIFCNRANTNTWYTLNKDSQPVELQQPALTGYLISIKFVPTEFRGKPSHKLQFKMMAHRPCTLVSGYESTFAKGFLIAMAEGRSLSIACLSPEQLRQRITIEAIPADDDNVLLCAVWLRNQKIYRRWDEQTNWKMIARKAMDNVAQIQRG